MTPLLDQARDYHRLGWALVPIPAGLKRSILRDWPNRRFGVADLDPTGNLAIWLGRYSGNLVDGDLDCEEAIELAPLYLPPTGAVFGRRSKPRAHWLYVSAGATFATFGDPVARATLLELRGDGRDGGAHLTLVPPSVADGERREWCGTAIEPAVVEARSLQRAMAWLAIGCLMLRYVSKHAARHPGPDLPRILWEFDHELGRAAYRWLGQPDPDAPRRYPRRRAEQNPNDIDLAELVAAIPNDCDWNSWNRVGLDGYGVTLNVGRGFDGWASIHNAARRLGDGDVILYFGDFDTSGEDMVRSLRERLGDQGARPEIIKCALTMGDIEAYGLPADFTKASDTRRAAFVAKWGDVSVELDALPIEVLRERIVGQVERHMDLTALEMVRAAEDEERRHLVQALGAIGGRT